MKKKQYVKPDMAEECIGQTCIICKSDPYDGYDVIEPDEPNLPAG